MKEFTIIFMKTCLRIWNYVMDLILDLLTLSPERFSEDVYKITLNISGALTSIAYGLLGMFFVFGLFKSVSSYVEFKRPEVLFKALCRLAIVKGLITYGTELLVNIMNLGQSIIGQAASAITTPNIYFHFPDELATAIQNETGGNWTTYLIYALISLIGTLIVISISFYLLLIVYSRYLKFYMYMAVSPIPLSTYAGEPTQQVGKQFIKNYAGVCLEAFIIYLAVMLGTFMTKSTNWISINSFVGDIAIVRILWFYSANVLNMLLISGTAKAADRVVHEMMGL